MATSGTKTFSLDTAEVIEEAYELAGLELRTGYDASSARRSLNIMFSDWSNRGINLWTVEQVTLDLVSGTSSYTLDQEHVYMCMLIPVEEYIIRGQNGIAGK